MRRDRFVRWVGLAIVALVCTAVDAGAAEVVERRYELHIDSALKLKLTDESTLHALEAKSEVGYSFRGTAQAPDLYINWLHLNVKQDGGVQEDCFMTRVGLRSTRGGLLRDTPFEKATGPLQEMLATFDRPAVLRTLDVDGRELTRTPQVKGAFAPTILGLADSLLSIHGPFPESAQRWEAPVKMALAQGHLASGTLRFEKLPGGKLPGMVKVKLAGQLTAAGKVAKGEVKNAVYKVTGEQVYDPAAHAWQSAKWNINMAFDMLRDDKPIGVTKGTMTLEVKPVVVPAVAAEANRATK